MLNMNRVTLLGHAGRDPAIRDLAKGERAASFTLATTERWTGKDGRPAEATEWHRVVVYGAAVAAVGTMLRKGDAVLVEGRIATQRPTVTRTGTTGLSPRSWSPARRARSTCCRRGAGSRMRERADRTGNRRLPATRRRRGPEA